MSLAQLKGLVNSSEGGILSQFPVNNLPNEILTRILTLVTRYGMWNSDLPYPTIDTNALILVSHVCHHWREVAVEASYLWSYIDLEFPDLVELFLSRCQSAPLTIVCHFGMEPPPLLRVIFTQHLRHIRHIRVSALYALPSFLIDFILHGSLPSLESVFLVSSSGSALPENFFGSHLPRLSRVKLLNISLPWSPPPFVVNSLTHLFITLGSIPRLSHLLETLQTQTSLVSLQLHASLPPPEPTSLPIVNLPMLQELQLSGVALALQSFLQCITYPRSAVLTLTVRSMYEHSENLAQFFAAQPSTIRSLYISDESNVLESTLRATNQDFAGRSHLQWKRSFFNSTIRLCKENTADQSLLPHLTALCRRLNLGDVTTLYCTTLHYWKDQWWSSIFEMMPNLQNLTLTAKLFTALKDCFKAGAGDSDDFQLQRSNSPHLPFLHVITILELWPAKSGNYEVIFDALKYRQDIGFPVKKLYLETYVPELPTYQEDFDRFSTNLKDIEIIARDTTGKEWFPVSNVDREAQLSAMQLLDRYTEQRFGPMLNDLMF